MIYVIVELHCHIHLFVFYVCFLVKLCQCALPLCHRLAVIFVNVEILGHIHMFNCVL